jgi:iron complex outermembrane recepter protein
MTAVSAALITAGTAPNFSVAGEVDPGFTPQELMGLSLEDLSNLQITSVSRRGQNISDAPASIFVITADDIRHSGATSLPEILRLAPNLQVARIDSVQYAISARGFNNSIGNKLLVLLDGRTIYTPLFSGVFWEMEDAFLQDIERVEVISGPGATLWGANAVNGVINIITRPAAQTQGVLLVGSTGEGEYGGGLRVGGTVGSANVRAYVKTRSWDNTNRENGTDAVDTWDRAQAGFRADWASDADNFTLQGDMSRGESGHRGVVGTIAIPAVRVAGANLLGRWTRELRSGSSLNVQAYWSRSDREEVILFSPKSDIFDLELMHDVAFDAHHLMWGGGYRYAKDDVTPGFITAVLPAKRSLDWQNIFMQDEWRLADDWTGTIGVKLEWNDYTGMEYLPNARLAWTPAAGHLLWSSVARAVRAPSRFDRDVYFPKTPPFIVAGGPEFESEVAKVLELGYRGTLSNTFTLAATLFHHGWEKLRSGTPLPLPTYLSNDLEGDTYGLEAWVNWQPARLWRISAGLTTLDKDLRFSPGGSDTRGPENPTLHNDPDFQWMLRSSLELGADLVLDMHLRRIDELTVEPVPAYSELNLRLAWVPTDEIEVALVGRNMLHNDHAEFGPPNGRSRIDRSVLLGARWLF